jgi:hypothetical protein
MSTDEYFSFLKETRRNIGEFDVPSKVGFRQDLMIRPGPKGNATQRIRKSTCFLTLART